MNIQFICPLKVNFFFARRTTQYVIKFFFRFLVERTYDLFAVSRKNCENCTNKQYITNPKSGKEQ